MAPNDETAVREQLIVFALALPEAWEDHPWGETVVKVRKKVFVFAGMGTGQGLRISVKLTVSRDLALDFDGAAPTGYGLGKAGWVTIPIGAAPGPILEDLIEESYRVVAPKGLAARLGNPKSTQPPA